MCNSVICVNRNMCKKRSKDEELESEIQLENEIVSHDYEAVPCDDHASLEAVERGNETQGKKFVHITECRRYEGFIIDIRCTVTRFQVFDGATKKSLL